jgi:hypothetical protein
MKDIQGGKKHTSPRPKKKKKKKATNGQTLEARQLLREKPYNKHMFFKAGLNS